MRTHAVSFVGLLLLCTLSITNAQNISSVLARYPEYSTFKRLMESTGVIGEVQTRSSLTILCPPDSVLNPFIDARKSYTTQMLADVIRYHVLLQYLDSAELRAQTNNGGMFTTLYQTTGRANELDGFVNITLTPSNAVAAGPSTAGTPPQATILGNITQFPYNYSFFRTDAVMMPLGLAAAQLAPTTPPTVAPVPAPVVTPMVAPVVAPVVAPAIAPVSVPAVVPVAPVEAPVVSPAIPPPMASPVPSMVTPIPAPSTPMVSPVASPPAPPTNGPSAEEPPAVEEPFTSPTNANSAVSVNIDFFAALASLSVAAFLF